MKNKKDYTFDEINSRKELAAFYKEYMSKRIAHLRKQMNVTAKEMSLSIGQSKGYINQIENKRFLPSIKIFFRICNFFKITPKNFFDLDRKIFLPIQKGYDKNKK